MVELFDYTIGILSGVAVSFVSYYLTYRFRERKRRERVGKAFIRELTLIKDNIKFGKPFNAIVAGTPVFSRLVTDLPLFSELNAELLLNTYSDIKICFRGCTTDDLNKLVKTIEVCVESLRKEVEHNHGWAPFDKK